MKLTPDDQLRRVRLVWLGWDGFTLPIHLPYQWYGLLAAIWAVLSVPFCLLFGVGGIPPALAAALLATTAIFKHVTPERPARKVMHTAFTDFKRSPTEPTGPTPLTKLSASHVTITEGDPR